jgi:hypothetical protein
MWFLVKTGAVLRVDEHMSIDSRRVEKVFSVIELIAKAGDGLVRVGAIADALRAENAPVAVWQIRADCTALAELGRIQLDPDSGAWVVAATEQSKGAA